MSKIKAVWKVVVTHVDGDDNRSTFPVCVLSEINEIPTVEMVSNVYAAIPQPEGVRSLGFRNLKLISLTTVEE